ncbi:hypothetical protein PFICI_09900 [Pestalotiopsis fici W106-1]|uniref:Heterokaryon incompatibility domain-containing protein n=1 Tax=Pestalotiopsis fici (strain W106-1 / CGMCC3.15140) TaxID=1229662 RepID=W3WVE0_PESFW|nr:uncharacterized protein PFICI_09900 [Pestalotiopsis fici W106-1]ETS77838.1 hypothetical protein PFICI_09900 [Pestalotiopsis fici W106-1]
MDELPDYPLFATTASQTIIDPFLAAIGQHARKFTSVNASLSLIIEPISDHFCDSLLSERKGSNLNTVSKTNLQQYAARCSVCSFLSQAIDAYLTGTHRENAHITQLGGYPHDTFFVSGLSSEDASICLSDSFYFFTPSDFSIIKDLPFRALCDVAPISEDTSSDTSLYWAKRQIATCDLGHNCLSSTQGSPLPTRVLDVSLRDTEKSIRLLTTARQRERYVCLSHCWGEQASIAKTTRQSFSAHTKNITLGELPKTFQDAIDITRRLGIDYLWIDSLCIIQDSEEDWENEASRMADIYEGAYLTIAATASKNGDEGCYRSNPPAIREMDFSYTTETGLQTRIHCRQFYQHFDLNMAVPPKETLNEFPLLGRGWIFQERFLSPRVLHFCNFELAFECRDGGRCQCKEERYGHGFKEDLMRLFAQGPSSETFQVRKGWWAVVRRYTRLRLTYDKDLLTALSGISRRVGASKPAGDYVAGIWKSLLPYGLLWYASPTPQDSFKRTDAPRAPSWSWASIIAPISWSLPHHLSGEKPLATINDINCEVSGHDVYGQAHGGVLVITGPTLTSNLRWQKGSLVSPGNHPDDYGFHFSDISNDITLQFSPDFPFFANEIGHCAVLCLWVVQSTILVLRPLEETGVFERIGLRQLSIFNDESWEIAHETLERSTLMTVKIV